MTTLVGYRVFAVEYHPVEHRANKERKGDNNISFLPVSPHIIRIQEEQVETISINISSSQQTVGHRPNLQAADLNFDAEIQYLPFKLNMGNEVTLKCVQQSQFINILRSFHYMISISDFAT